MVARRRVFAVRVCDWKAALRPAVGAAALAPVELTPISGPRAATPSPAAEGIQKRD